MAKLPEIPLSGHQIYEQIQGGAGAGALTSAVEALFDLSKQILERGERCTELSKKINGGWQGNAGGAASGSAQLLSGSSLADKDNLRTGCEAIQCQVESFYRTFYKVQPVSEQRPQMTKKDIFDQITGGHSYHDKLADWQAGNITNIQAFADYHAASIDNANKLPTSFQQLSTTDKTSDGTESNVSEGITYSPAGGKKSPVPVPRTHGTAIPISTAPPTTTSAALAQNATNTPHEHITGGITASNPTNGGTQIAASIVDGLTPFETPNSNQPWRTSGNENSWGTGPGYGINGGFTNGSTPIDPAIKAAPARNQGRATGTSPLPENLGSSRVGAGPSAVKAGASGAPFGGPPASSTREDDDHEHQRLPFLQEANPDDLFLGGLEITTAPVIGEIRKPQR